MEATVVRVTSRDGTPIACWRSGSGPPLVLVHGTSGDHTRWPVVLGELERHYTVYAMDRRGRGGSGDTEPYALEREAEDIAAVVEALDGPVRLLGHSYGALCCLEAALHTSNLHRLALYEPPLTLEEGGGLVGGIGTSPALEAAYARIEALLQAGDRDVLLTTFLQRIAGIPPADVEALRAHPSWEARKAAAHTIPRELRAAHGRRLDGARLRALRVPTLLLMGGASPAWVRPAMDALAAVLPNSTVAVMPGQGHVAMNTGPELFLREVVGFLRG